MAAGMRTQYILILFSTVLAVAVPATGMDASERTVVMISLDGAKLTYFSKKETPHIYNMGERGWATRLIPVFPTVTFPNHASLVTGCTAEEHGIVSNHFQDPKRGSFDMSTDSNWMLCEPLWVTAEKAGAKTAIALWPMSWGPWNGTRTSYYFPATVKTKEDAMKTSAASRLNQILTWLKLPEDKRPQLILSWLGDIDHQAHSFGPNSPQVKAAVKKYDTLIGKFLTQLKKLPAAHSTDVLIVSDHGMSTTHHYISIDYIIAQLMLGGISDVTIEHSGPLANVYLKISAMPDVVRAEKLLAHVGEDGKIFSTYRQDMLPDDWHYHHPRSGQLILMARTDDIFTRRGDAASLYYIPGKNAERGNHGYPPDNMEMQAIFFAQGPDFSPAETPSKFYTLGVAPLIKRILSLP